MLLGRERERERETPRPDGKFFLKKKKNLFTPFRRFTPQSSSSSQADCTHLRRLHSFVRNLEPDISVFAVVSSVDPVKTLFHCLGLSTYLGARYWSELVSLRIYIALRLWNGAPTVASVRSGLRTDKENDKTPPRTGRRTQRTYCTPRRRQGTTGRGEIRRKRTTDKAVYQPMFPQTASKNNGQDGFEGSDTRGSEESLLGTCLVVA